MRVIDETACSVGDQCERTSGRGTNVGTRKTATEAGSVPEAAAFRVKGGFVLRQPVDGVIQANGGAEEFLVGEVEEDEGGDVGVFGGAADGEGGPGAAGLLKIGDIGEAAVDGNALPARAHEGPEAKGGDDRIAPAAVGFLGGEDRADEFLVEGVSALRQFVEADEAEGGDGYALRKLTNQTQGELRPGGKKLPGEAVILAGVPETINLADGLHHTLPFNLGGIC